MAERELTIETMIYGGAGLAHNAEETVLVPFTLPGERVLASTYDGQRNADLLQIIEASPKRTQARCVHFGVCGGCQYQHATYDEQLNIKRNILLDTFTRAGITTSLEPQIHSAEPWHYRNRIQLRAEKINGRTQLGYSQRGTNTFLPITMCPIAAEPLWQATEAITTLWNSSAIAAQPLREVELFINNDNSQMQASFYLDVAHSTMDREAATQFRDLCTKLKENISTLHGAGLFVWAAPATPKQRHRTTLEVVRWGEPTLQYSVNDLHYTVSRGGFFQVNLRLLPELMRTVIANRSGNLAWDLYAGAGLFTQSLATKFANTVSVESGERSFESLNDLTTRLGKNHRALRAETLTFLRNQSLASTTPDLAIVDPPRAGLGIPTCDALITARPQTIVYVSCDPTTLSRDLKRLIESGYRLVELHLVDLFPQTFHMETVAVLSLQAD